MQRLEASMTEEYLREIFCHRILREQFQRLNVVHADLDLTNDGADLPLDNLSLSFDDDVNSFLSENLKSEMKSLKVDK